ncbi:hypothetical protein T492DRAFT_856715 [Pavlovales sp. CCMP2436]|nr:hypothetical protein T492DRAFT_856715 [Pavlovales sp. CCMP2436]
MTTWAKSKTTRFSMSGRDSLPGPCDYDPNDECVRPRVTVGGTVGTADRFAEEAEDDADAQMRSAATDIAQRSGFGFGALPGARGGLRRSTISSARRGGGVAVRAARREVVEKLLAELRASLNALDGIEGDKARAIGMQLAGQIEQLEKACLEQGTLGGGGEEVFASATPSAFPSRGNSRAPSEAGDLDEVGPWRSANAPELRAANEEARRLAEALSLAAPFLI